MPMNAATQEPDITLASTTESQAELDHATGPNWRAPFTPPETKDETKPAGSEKDESKTAPVSETGKAGAKEGKSEGDEDETPLPKGVQKRLDRMRARTGELERELAELRRGQQKPEPAKAATDKDPEPQQKDFKTWEEYQAAHNRWVVRDETRKQQAEDTKQREQTEAKETYDAHISRVETYRADHPDIDDKIAAMGTFEFASPQANMAFQIAIVHSDDGPEIMEYLADHPDEMDKFAEASPARVGILVGRISAKLSPSGSEKTPTSGTPAPTKVTSKAPPPTTKVRNSATAPTNIYDPESAKKMTDDDWIRKREEDVRARNRRRN